jgi:hypothetical protein
MNNLRSLLGPDPEAFYNHLLINLELILLSLRLKIEGTERTLVNALAPIATTVTRFDSDRSTVCSLVDHDFYARFKKVIGNATVGVHITHLDTLPPNRPRKTEANDYYSSIAEIVKSRPRVSFRRVERFSTEKKEWIEELVNDYTGVDNFSLAVLLLESRERYTGLVSVQIVDDHQTALVAVAEHYSSIGPRDVWISDKSCTSLWTSYYENILWRPAAKVLENGRLNTAEYNRVKSFRS